MKKKETSLIVFTRHTPYLVVNLDVIEGQGHKKYSLSPVTTLCRCGGTKKAPYCDGSHQEKGLNEVSSLSPLNQGYKDYLGQAIVVHFNKDICCHSGLCHQNLPEVFNTDKRPWINPDRGTLEAIIETIHLCPSGALTYSIEEEHFSEFYEVANLQLEKDGPIKVTGPIGLCNDTEATPACKDHYTLCRCGQSKNKPFCDGSHKNVDFKSEA